MQKLKVPERMSCPLAEEIGLHLGDGSMNYYHNRGLYQLRGHICDDLEHYVKRIIPLYKILFGLDLKLRKMPASGVCGFQIWSNKLVEYKHKVISLPLGKKTNFKIPKEIICNPLFVKSFLRGYFDTDGCLYLENKRGKLYPRVEMASVSRPFMDQLALILSQLGFKFSYYTENRRSKGWNNLHRIIIRGHMMVRKWFTEVEPANPKHQNKLKKIKYGPAEI